MIAIQCSLVHNDVSIGIHNIPLLRIFFSNVAVNKLNAGRCLVLNFIHSSCFSSILISFLDLFWSLRSEHRMARETKIQSFQCFISN